MTKFHFEKRILDLKNKIGNLLILLSNFEDEKNKKFINRKKLEVYFSPSKINKEKIENLLISEFNNKEEVFCSENIINILEKDFLHFNKYK